MHTMSISDEEYSVLMDNRVKVFKREDLIEGLLVIMEMHANISYNDDFVSISIDKKPSWPLGAPNRILVTEPTIYDAVIKFVNTARKEKIIE